MMRRLLLTLALITSTARAEIPKEHKSAFSRAKSSLGSAEMRLKTSQKQEAGSDGADKAVQETEQRLAKATELVKEIPATEPEMVEFNQRVEAVKAEIAKRRGAAGQVKAEAAADSADLEKGADADLSTMAALRERLPGLRAYLADNLTIDGLELWPRLRQDAAAMVKKYDGKRGQSAAAKKMEEETTRLKADLADAQRSITDYVQKSLPRMIPKYLELADTGTKPGNEDTNIEAYVGNLRYHHRTSVMLDKFELLAKAEAGTDTSFVAAARAKLDEIEKRVEKAKVKVVAKAKLPAEIYEGADKEKLRGTVKEAWLTVNPQFPPLKIVLSQTEWTRRTEWVWATDRWRKVDLSTMEAWVVIKADDKTANYYGCYLVKDHLNGGRLTVKVDPTKGKPATWNQVVLLSKL